MQNIENAEAAIQKAWPSIVQECSSVLGSELHYQAMIYHCLRTSGNVPIKQLGMNVKMWVNSPITPLFRKLDHKKKEPFQGGFEPIPDICLFSKDVNSDWRRRNYKTTIQSLLVAIEVKASERAKGRLRPGEIIQDIRKIAALRDEAYTKNVQFTPMMLIIDTAPEQSEQMTKPSLDKSLYTAQEEGVKLLYMSKTIQINTLFRR